MISHMFGLSSLNFEFWFMIYASFWSVAPVKTQCEIQTWPFLGSESTNCQFLPTSVSADGLLRSFSFSARNASNSCTGAGKATSSELLHQCNDLTILTVWDGFCATHLQWNAPHQWLLRGYLLSGCLSRPSWDQHPIQLSWMSGQSLKPGYIHSE